MNQAIGNWEQEIDAGERFAFGANWSSYLRLLNPDRIRQAEQSLQTMLGLERLEGKTFLDIGSGSGLFSLAARQLGAKVTSFDYDPQSVACTEELKRRHFPNDDDWTVLRGSVLEREFMQRLGVFDIVYSWGVLHHTGAMWPALEAVAPLVAANGLLFIAIYNDQGRASRRWNAVKRAYVGAPGPLKWLVLLPTFGRLWGPTIVRDTLAGHPLRTWTSYPNQNARGMDAWRDTVDWVGGYPFEVAKPEQILDFFRERGFTLTRMKTCGGGLGCNEFVFVRASAGPRD
jgi:2-polyprenyl-3-methyl-5-hydroxy-6-metoxy-1,4-benzoquinol methylase